jgi:hypothetical protein
MLVYYIGQSDSSDHKIQSDLQLFVSMITSCEKASDLLRLSKNHVLTIDLLSVILFGSLPRAMLSRGVQ